jgi:hypothetical protein
MLDVEHLMAKIFDRSDKCVGLFKPVPSQVTLIEPILDKAPDPLQMLQSNVESIAPLSRAVFKNDFHNAIVEVLDAFDVHTSQCSYRGSRAKEFRQLFPTCEHADVMWDETSDQLDEPLSAIYILACESREKLSYLATKFQTLNFVSTASARYTCAVFRDPGFGKDHQLAALWDRFQWRQARQVLELEKLAQWLSERNLKDSVEYAPPPDPPRFESYLYAYSKPVIITRNLYLPVSPVYRKVYRPVSPIYRSGVSWLNQHIQMTQ